MRTRLHVSGRTGRQAGLSLVELALALAVLGVAIVLAVQHGANLTQRRSAGQSQHVLERVESAALAFAFVHGRLVCPAPDTGGLEACDGKTQGYMPYRTLGLPDASAAGMRYRLDSLRLAAAGAGGFEVLVPLAQGERQDLLAQAVPLRTVAGDGYDRMPDFCAVLGRKGEAAPPGGDTGGGDVAFVLEAPGGWLDGPGSAGRTVRRSKIFGRLNCGALLATAGRAHFNVRLESAVMHRALQDYRTQFNIAYALYEWDLSQSIWFVSNSSYSAVKTIIKFQIACAPGSPASRRNPGRQSPW